MDTTTHALAGYVIAKTGISGDTGKWGAITGVTAAVLPDVDLFLGLLGTEISLKYHRNLTNSVFLIIPLSLVLAWAIVRISKVRRFWTFFLIGVVEILVHTFMDLATSYGTMILSPFSNPRFALDWLFIVDFLLVFAFLFPLIALRIWKSKSQVLARFSVLLAGLYVGLCACNHSWALSLAKNYAGEKNLAVVNVAALPQPLSPFRWANYVQTEKRIYQGFVNLIGGNEEDLAHGRSFLSRLRARYQPIPRLRYGEWERFDNSPWVKKALRLDGVKTFYWFARFPVARHKTGENGAHRVEFFDLRFGMIHGIRPFLYVVDFDPNGAVAFQGFLE